MAKQKAVVVPVPEPEFVFRAGSRVSGVTAAVARQELLRIQQEHGGIEPCTVVETAADPKNPLHPAFEWDDTEAARQHRLAQARGLIKSVRLVVADSPRTLPAFLHVRVDRQASYQPIEVVVQNQNLFDAAIAELGAKLESATRSVADVETAAKLYRPELAGEADAIRGFLAGAQEAAGRMRKRKPAAA